ncbi:MAG: polysaccharide pyruvyl transferase family protein [Treponema sp.]|jgi:hypothetical protein|nr:polysaccharide pyruvyl transferase family protein [Treponema sp.]
MKIGIMTLWQSNGSYGQLLQHYALQKYLRDRGHEPYLIRYDYLHDGLPSGRFSERVKRNFNFDSIVRFIKRKRMQSQLYHEEAKDKKAFNRFRAKYIKISSAVYRSYNELVQNPPDADVYITGSDTVWCFVPEIRAFKSVSPRCRAYFLDFGKSGIIRIAYAASFSTPVVDKQSINEITPYLKKFNYISVRENSSLNILNECGISGSDWVPDPALLLNADMYRKIYKQERTIKPKDRFCLLYKINESADFNLDVVYAWAQEYALEVIYVAGGQTDRYKKYNATIYDWLYLIDNAQYIITNSFHGAVFSVVFNKPFAVFPLTGGFSQANIRLKSFFELLETDRYIANNNLDILNIEIGWDGINKKINSMQDYINDVFHKIVISNTPPPTSQLTSIN